MISPKGGVGKTTSTFVLGNAVCSQVRLRAIVVDANPDFGTLGALAPDAAAVPRTLAELLAELGPGAFAHAPEPVRGSDHNSASDNGKR